MPNNFQKGFTLLELMISLVLGLLICAAGLMVFLNGQRSLALQGGMNELQQNANFGLAMLTHDLRLTNLNTPSTQKVNNKQVGSGIVFVAKDGSGVGTAGNLPSSLSGVSPDLLTKQESDDGATLGKNEQLTIQYIPAYTRTVAKACPAGQESCTEAEKKDVTTYAFNGYDCEGNRLSFSEARVIVQRYHLKPDTSQVSGQPTAYSLYCDAGNYVAGDASITGMTSSSNNGQQIMQRIDAFKVRLQVKDSNNKMRYMTINEYLALMPVKLTDEKSFYNITAVEISILARSTSPLNSESLIDNNKTFKMFGNDDLTLKLNSAQQKGPKYLREVFSQVVAFRNTLGAS
ncbi:PilW family protein [Acinetobacter dispersus]|uniref:Prepilin-type N-terminal cleavage/methylation domain-containing protein n=1 Tax=Acinetobacter dispersus TaxID=70348 RepID=N9ML21_9GAMM|nr:PilW family protein [Acinetobacter dispersus]ENW93985.1 hypothetical protein F904_00893 [Acinetobacter dispersus]